MLASIPLQQIAQATTHTQPPQPQKLWESEDLGGGVFSVSWSPDGTKLAAGIGWCSEGCYGRVFVYSSTGQKLWESENLGDWVFSVSWSPDGTKIAVGGGFKKVIVYSSSGKLLWESQYLDGWVRSVSWSPDGEKLAVGIGIERYGEEHNHGRVFVYSSTGQKLWESENLGDWVFSVSWSPDGTKIAVGTGWYNSSTDIFHGRVFVYSSTGQKLWESEDLGGGVFSVSWSPDGTKIAVGGGFKKVIVYSSMGKLLWESGKLGGWVFSVSWSPDGTKIAVGGLFNKTIVYSSTGQKLWESEDLGGGVFSVSWSPDGTKIAVGIGWEEKIGDEKYYHGRVFVYSWNFGVVWVSGGLFDYRVCFFDGSTTDCYRLNSSGLMLYADPGTYKVTYRLLELPSGYKFIGDVASYLSDNPVTETLTVEAGGNYSLSPPSLNNFLSKLGKLVIYGPAGTAVKITWGSSGEASYTIPDSSVLELYAVPETAYLVQASPPGGSSFVKVGSTYISGEGKVKEIDISNVLTTTTTTITTSVAVTSSWSWLPLFLVVGVSGVVVLALLAVRRGRGSDGVSRELVGGGAGGELAHPRSGSSIGVGESAVVSETSSSVFFGIVESLLNERISGLVGGFGCVEGFSPRVVELKRGIAPEGFEGSWTCCLLGCGGWGCAYLCRREGGEVVFKVPRGFEQVFEGGFIPTVHARLVERIRSEAEVLRGLKHPNILKLLGAARSAPVLAYEFADGGSLDWQLARGWKPSMRDVLLVGIQVGDALRYIHSRGLVHGDIKPGNVFIKNGVVKVGDFSSIIRLVSMTSKLSKMSYTPGFRAPEQVYADLRRKVKELGLESRIDTYLLGNLLLYLLTGGSVDGEEAVGGGEVEKAVEEIEDPELRKIVKEALNPDPLQRPSTEEVVKKLLKIWVDRYEKH